MRSRRRLPADGRLGYLRDDGNIVFVGRLKEMFKSGGYNVYPLEIEQAIAEHPDVLLAAVLPVPHPLYQEVGHAFVMPIQGRNVAADDLRAFLKDRIANYKVPKAFTIESGPAAVAERKDRQASPSRATRYNLLSAVSLSHRRRNVWRDRRRGRNRPQLDKREPNEKAGTYVAT